MDSHMNGLPPTRYACSGSFKLGDTFQGSLSLGVTVAVLLSGALMNYKIAAMADREHSHHYSSLAISRTAHEMLLIGLFIWQSYE
jgi:hypothetical protein